MFGGIPELFIILVVIFAAWHVVKAFNRMQPRPPAPRQAAPPRAQIEAEDLVNCRVCGSYIAASARNCGRPACPRPR